jgi:hypothetical protein
MDDSLLQKEVFVKISSLVPLSIVDDQGVAIGSAYMDGHVMLRLVIDKHHPAALDLETENGLAKLKLSARIQDNVVSGVLVVGG